jgi:hypothetical protein
MSSEEVLGQFNSLPPDGQRQVLDLIASLQQRYAASQIAEKPKQTDITSEPFIGMWRDRPDLEDSSEWVRASREREWMRRSG